jgi:hypothetical protein
MKLKIIGFKVGKSRPTANHTVKDANIVSSELDEKLGNLVRMIAFKSDFISIRRVDE